MDRQRILALDLATRTGWALGSPKETPASGSVRFAGHRFLELYDWLSAREFDVAFVEAMVAPSYMAGATTTGTVQLLAGMIATVELFCDRNAIPHHSATVAQIRTHFLGHNRLPRLEAKRATIQRCKALGWAPADDNAADALALWDYACGTLSPLGRLANADIQRGRAQSA